jgi:hypothetical protein
MLDFVRIERVALEHVGATLQRELRRRKEGKQKALGTTVRAIAAQRARRRIGIDGETHGTTVALSFKRHDALPLNLPGSPRDQSSRSPTLEAE